VSSSCSITTLSRCSSRRATWPCPPAATMRIAGRYRRCRGCGRRRRSPGCAQSSRFTVGGAGQDLVSRAERVEFVRSTISSRRLRSRVGRTMLQMVLSGSETHLARPLGGDTLVTMVL
jgi:hypothetical protein